METTDLGAVGAGATGSVPTVVVVTGAAGVNGDDLRGEATSKDNFFPALAVAFLGVFVTVIVGVLGNPLGVDSTGV